MSIALTRRTGNLAMPLALAAMDACWIFAVAWMVQQVFLYPLKPYPVPNPLVLAVLWFAGWWIAGRAIYSNLDTRVAQALAVLAGLVATVGLLLVLYPPGEGTSPLLWIGRAAFTGIVCLGVWSLGSYRTTDTLDFNIAFKMFIAGMSAMVFSFVFANIVSIRELAGYPTTPYLQGVGPIPMWFVGASLLAMALGNRELVRRETGSSEARFWTPVLVGCVLFVLLLSLLGGGLSAGSVWDFITGLIAWTLFAVGLLLHSLLYLVLSGFIIDLPLLRRNEIPASDQQTQNVPDPYEELRRQFDQMGTRQPPIDLQNIFTLLALALVCIAVFAALFMVGRRLRRTREDRSKDLPEDRENFGSWALLKQQISQWWRALLARLFPKRRTEQTIAAVDELAALRGDPNLSGTLSVRQIYARMQASAARIGYPRAPQQTPLEYLDILSRAMPQLRPDFAAITSAYIEARYSPLPASAPAVTSATNAWKRAEPQMTHPSTMYRSTGA